MSVRVSVCACQMKAPRLMALLRSSLWAAGTHIRERERGVRRPTATLGAARAMRQAVWTSIERAEGRRLQQHTQRTNSAGELCALVRGLTSVALGVRVWLDEKKAQCV